MIRGGKTSTTWARGSGWRSGETKVIRVPVAIADQIMAYARELDWRLQIADWGDRGLPQLQSH